MTVESRDSGARRDAVARQRLGKHIPEAMNTHATIGSDDFYAVRAESSVGTRHL
jgi:hypothetical protein